MSKEQIVGLFFLGGLLLVVVAVELTVGTGILRRGYPLYAEFHDAGGLDPGSAVRVAGVKAGKVDAVELRPTGVRVKMLIDKGIVVPQGAVAQLESQVLGGQRSVNLAIPAQPAVASGDAGADGESTPPPGLPPESTVPAEDSRSLAQLLNQLGRVADSLDRNAGELLVNLNTLVEENRVAISRSLANLDAISTEVAAGKGTLGKLVQDPKLYDEATASLAAMRASFGNLNIVTQRLVRGEGTLGKLLTNDGLYNQAEEAIASLHRTTDNLVDISDGLRDGQGTLGKLLTDDSLYHETQEAVRSVNRATQGIEDQAPISVLSTFASSLF